MDASGPRNQAYGEPPTTTVGAAPVVHSYQRYPQKLAHPR